MNWQPDRYFVFLGSCTMDVIEDFRAFASIVKGRRNSDNSYGLVGARIVDKGISYQEDGILGPFLARGRF